jgi:hypothetical protein
MEYYIQSNYFPHHNQAEESDSLSDKPVDPYLSRSVDESIVQKALCIKCSYGRDGYWRLVGKGMKYLSMALFVLPLLFTFVRLKAFLLAYSFNLRD